ncbi:Hypothetical_protein [Hexamita inflata]|uniref:Hypothetical_protein n=1 Tax=Hexamita inflata TaxID=28002 RepID=A0AA86P9J1_9EUKA|nr:Hypothetical protein HINF_LOCUS22227 [Hexamita inflata]
MSNIITNSTGYMQFGGIIQNQTRTIAIIQDITLQIYENWITQYINRSGQIIGQISTDSENSIQNVCALDYLSTSSNIYMYGLIGLFSGQTLQIYSVSTEFYYISGDLDLIGTFGYIQGLKLVIYNADIIMQMQMNNTGYQAGVLFAVIMSQSWQVGNITVKNSLVSSYLCSGLITSYMNQGSFNQIYIYSSSAISNSTSLYSLSGALSGDSTGGLSRDTIINQIYVFNVSIATYSQGIWSISGGLVGDTHEANTYIQNVQIVYSTITSNGPITSSVQSAGLIATLYNAITNIQNTIINSSNISSSTTTKHAFSGGLLAAVTTQITIANSKIISVNLSASGVTYDIGTIFSNLVSFTATQLRSEGVNTVNGAIVTNCGNIQNFGAQNGC